ncbi:LuxR family two component transcriptional regulator [Stackebrandtia endophytica]|uniref:LuxR family two component transcriptional regulator n=1 Tax=Stackebrandtia endophytica TaxID=1496996 RepID=A0A543ARJ5_9ACTN|nr:response regulator transcription factor [Stackebrandtia endophytica]TQL75199.1 LuxR family two component transcriptional regulator [Stackebrandtia endophytica]
MINVLIADDHAAVRTGLVLICEGADDITVIGEAADGVDAVEQTLRLRPDVVVMDIRMPRLDGISATERLAGSCDVLILTTYGSNAHVFAALAAGAAGFLLKDTDADTLVEAIRVVARGDGLISPAVTRDLIKEFGRRRPRAEAAGLSLLTGRERQVFARLGQGMSNAAIAADLSMAEATAKTHVSRVLTKLGLRSRVQAAILAQESGIQL